MQWVYSRMHLYVPQFILHDSRRSMFIVSYIPNVCSFPYLGWSMLRILKQGSLCLIYRCLSTLNFCFYKQLFIKRSAISPFCVSLFYFDLCMRSLKKYSLFLSMSTAHCIDSRGLCLLWLSLKLCFYCVT